MSTKQRNGEQLEKFKNLAKSDSSLKLVSSNRDADSERHVKDKQSAMTKATLGIDAFFS